jgi:hypothetical protein
MTAAQWEAWTERIAIMEYEGRLDRKAATLMAFELYFPTDYRVMKKAATGTEDEDAALYEFLDGLIARPETAIEGATMNAEIKRLIRRHAEKPAYGPL